MKSVNQITGTVKTLNKIVESQYSPVALFEQLSKTSSSDNRILLESSEIDSKRQLKSIIVNKSALRIECDLNQVTVTSVSSNGENALLHLSQLFNISISQNVQGKNQIKLLYQELSEQTEDLDEDSRLKKKTPIDCLRKIKSAFKSKNGNNYSIFLAGLFSFDLIASFEKLPEVELGRNTCPDYVFYLAEEVIEFDHQTHRSAIYSNIFSGIEVEKNYFEQSRRMQAIAETMDISQIKTNGTPSSDKQHSKPTIIDEDVECDISDLDYQNIVNDLKQEIVAGNVFQVVPSRTFSMNCINELKSYQKLKETNPSPYMFFMQDQNFSLFGASPESALKYQHKTRQVELYPIAGTRARGKNSDGTIDHDLDKRFETELKLDNKEISEHMMLVDLARNDISRISNTGSITIPRLLEIDRYSQVMHLVSCVQGKLRDDLDCFHAYQACMNMGTLTGAPKIKATEIIRQTEKTRRGSYGGAVGYINNIGDMDSCIVIRSAFCRNAIAHIQAGAGIVFDSVPASEAEETQNKANAVILAIQLANHEEKQKEKTDAI